MSTFPELVIDPHTTSSLEGWKKIKVWINSRNDPSASIYEQNQEYLLRVPEVAHYHFSSTSSRVIAYPFPEVPSYQVERYYYIFVLPVIFQTAGYQSFHASGVLTPEGVIAFCGDSYAGKSTLAYSLMKRGYMLWADDVVIFSGVISLKLPCDIKLRRESALYFHDVGIPLGAGHPIHRPIRALFLLHRSSESKVEVTQLLPSTAFLQVLEHAHSFKCEDLGRKAQMVKAYVELISNVSIYKLSFPTGLDYIPQIIEAIEAAIS